MKERKMSSDIVSAIFSVLLSTFLIILTAFFSFYLSFMFIIEDGGIVDIARTAGQEVLKEEIPVMSKSFERYGFKEEEIDKFLRSKAVKEASSLYGEDVLAALQGDSEGEAKFTTENVQAALVSHLDELVDIATHKNMKEEDVLKAESRIVSAIRENTDGVVKSVTPKEEIVKAVKRAGIGDFLHIVLNPSVKTVFWIFIITSCIGIYALRYYKFGGLVWLGTDFIFSGVILLIAVILSSAGFFNYMLVEIIEQDVISNLAIWVFTKGMIFACAALFGIAILCFVVFRFLKKYILKGE